MIIIGWNSSHSNTNINQWVRRSPLPTNEQLHDITFGNDLYVAVYRKLTHTRPVVFMN